MLNNKAKQTIYDKFGVENIRQCEEYVNICRPNKSSEVYKQFEELVEQKVNQATQWLSSRNIDYSWNERIDGHLYRLYIPDKDLLLDFEYYPVINMNYNYIRINYYDNIILILEKLYPQVIFETNELELHYKVSQKEINRFLKENGHSPIYDNSLLRMAWVDKETICQCYVLKGNQIISNVTRRGYKINHGTFMLLRYLNEMFEIPEIVIKDSLDNSFNTDAYPVWGLKIINKTSKKKIWWNGEHNKWHISQSEIDNYVPFYFTEKVVYSYKK